MIGGLFFLASIIAIFIVLHWFTRNDGIAEDQPTTGWLALRLPSDQAPKPTTPRRWTREKTFHR